MKLNWKLPLALGVALTVALTVAPRANAQFAAVVTDPTSYAWFAKVWESDVSTEVKMSETIAQGTTMISQGLQIYNLAVRETTALRNKQWMQAAGVLSQLNFGPAHSNWNTALRSAAGPLGGGRRVAGDDAARRHDREPHSNRRFFRYVDG